jgi:hypothetical protein
MVHLAGWHHTKGIISTRENTVEGSPPYTAMSHQSISLKFKHLASDSGTFYTQLELADRHGKFQAIDVGQYTANAKHVCPTSKTVDG